MIYAFLAAIVWGIEYSVAEHVLDRVPLALFLFAESVLVALAALVMLRVSGGSLVESVPALVRDRPTLGWFCFGVAACAVAGLIEVSYPVFTAIFTLLFFRENHFDFATVAGGALIFSGIAVIFVFSRHA